MISLKTPPKYGQYITLFWRNGSVADCIFVGLDKSCLADSPIIGWKPIRQKKPRILHLYKVKKTCTKPLF